MAAHASILAWIILWTEELGRLQSMGSQRVRHNLMTKTFFFFFEVTQSCPTLCDSMDSSPPGFSIHGVFQARILEWVAISFSND